MKLTGYGLDTETELKMLEAIFELDKSHEIHLIPTFLPAHAVPPEFKENSDEYVDLICDEMLPLAKQTLDSRLSTLDSSTTKYCETKLSEERAPAPFRLRDLPP